MIDMQQGGNAALAGGSASVAFAWTGHAPDADVSAYLLTAAGTVRGDGDMVFYNQPDGADGAVRFAATPGTRGRFAVDPARLPAGIERVVFCVTVPGVPGRTLAQLGAAEITVAGADGGPVLRFRPDLTGATEAAMIFGELYRRGDAWKFRAVGQGFDGGLAPLARSFGIDVAEPAPPAAPPPLSPVRLSKVTLDKPGQTVNLRKKGDDFGEIVVNLNWSRARKGLFGGTAIDLDLGCLWELADGRKGVVQALGNGFGSFAQAPFIALSGDDRTGDMAAGETLRVNGAHWAQLRGIAVFANIYAGAPNWQATDGVVTVTMPHQTSLEVPMTEGRNDRRVCGVVLIENDRGELKATRIVEYLRDQQVLDEQLGWGLRWVAGRKT